MRVSKHENIELQCCLTNSLLVFRLAAYKDDVLRGIDWRLPNVLFINNQAEQDLRMMKVKQKISSDFRTMDSAQTLPSFVHSYQRCVDRAITFLSIGSVQLTVSRVTN